MTWSILREHGSWTTCVSDDPVSDVPTALALPGSWLWHEVGVGQNVLVRNDQLDSLYPPMPPAGPPVINDYYPKPVTSGAEMLIGGSALDTCVRIDITPKGENVISVLPPYELQQENEVRFITPTNQSGPATIAAYNASNETGGALDMVFA